MLPEAKVPSQESPSKALELSMPHPVGPPSGYSDKKDSEVVKIAMSSAERKSGSIFLSFSSFFFSPSLEGCWLGGSN